ncbi:MAG: DUF4835 family protein [Muribaculaceae bacterium]|nr:DUF4835 family protein [Muribaculaceae bacterium]
MKHFLLTAALLLLSFATPKAQELNCKVTVNSDQINGSSKSVFETLQQAIADYMNTTVFTPMQFSPNEKIDCNLFFTIKEYNDDQMSGDLQIQATRPVYNSSYTTTLINFKDTKLDFTYRENEPLVFSPQNWENQLTGILNFYAYLIIAMDCDSFAPHGGDEYYERLGVIVQQGQSSGETGWKAFEDTKNRYAVLASLTDPSTSGIRDLLYQYHRRGLDEMVQSPDKGRAAITETLTTISDIQNKSPMSVALSMFKDAKLDELVNLYSKAPVTERSKVYNLLEPIYPTETERLEQLKKGADER